MVILREFLYRRDNLVAQFLEQIEGGIYDEERLKEQAGRKSAVGGSAALGAVSVAAERRRDGASETELTMRQTAASRFNRLHALLSKGNDIQPLTSFDDAIWAQIASGEVVELEGTLTLLPGVLEMGQAAGIGSFLSLIEAMKDLPDVCFRIPSTGEMSRELAGSSLPFKGSPNTLPQGRCLARSLQRVRQHAGCSSSCGGTASRGTWPTWKAM